MKCAQCCKHGVFTSVKRVDGGFSFYCAKCNEAVEAVPDDYQPCDVCGYDHVYDQDFEPNATNIRKAHEKDKP